MSQASKIREISLVLLTTENDLIETIKIGDRSFNGIRYHKLYNFLESYKEYEFTSGAITGALQTLTDRIKSIKKFKTDKGVYFIYSDVPISTQEKHIVDSNEYKEIVQNVKRINILLSKILKDASKNSFYNATDYDLDTLRKIFNKNNELLNMIELYQIDKYILNSHPENKLSF